MERKLLAIIVFAMIASLSVAGCTVGLPSTASPTPTPTPSSTSTSSTDLSSYFQNYFESGNSIIERPFTKSTNERGNDVYKGVGRNASLPGSKSVTIVVEVTKSEAEAKQVHDSQVSEKLNQGYTPDPTDAAQWQTNNPGTVAVWIGYYGDSYYNCYYIYDVHGWLSIADSLSLTS
jgi:hypothetical protein